MDDLLPLSYCNRPAFFVHDEVRMAIISALDQVLDAVAQLPVEDQQSLIDIVSRRIRENRRRECIADVLESRREYARGECRPMSVEEIMKEVDS